MTQERTIHQKLSELATNLWWSWQPEVTSIFREIDSQLWTDLSHNPIRLLREYHPEKLETRAREAVLHARIHGAYRRWQEYMHSDQTWGDTHAAVLGHRPAAYFSAEFGIHESLRVYSGGLGVLAGDHLKSASDLGIPLVAIVFVDGAFGNVRRIQEEQFGNRLIASDLANPDFVRYAQSYGAKGSRVTRTEDLVSVLDAAFEGGGVHLVDVPIDYSENIRVLVDELSEQAGEMHLG